MGVEGSYTIIPAPLGFRKVSAMEQTTPAGETFFGNDFMMLQLRGWW
jgi:hypothetical protein